MRSRCWAYVYAVPFAAERCNRPVMGGSAFCEEHDPAERDRRRRDRDADIARRAAEEERLLALLAELEAGEEGGDGCR